MVSGWRVWTEIEHTNICWPSWSPSTDDQLLLLSYITKSPWWFDRMLISVQEYLNISPSRMQQNNSVVICGQRWICFHLHRSMNVKVLQPSNPIDANDRGSKLRMNFLPSTESSLMRNTSRVVHRMRDDEVSIRQLNCMVQRVHFCR